MRLKHPLHKVTVTIRQNGTCQVLSTCSIKENRIILLDGWGREEKGLGALLVPLQCPFCPSPFPGMEVSLILYTD
jgi:hypothetical protein